MGIQQRLHTKLVQKLILTPSLQQAIKLLPMSTLELSDLLNQEMVENPMLEEVPTEDLQPADALAQEQEKPPAEVTNKTDTWDDQDYEYFFGDYLDDGYRPRAPQEVRELPPIENTLSTSTSSGISIRSRAAATTRTSRSTSFPTSTSSRSKTSTSPCSMRTACRRCASAPSTAGCSTRAPPRTRTKRARM